MSIVSSASAWAATVVPVTATIEQMTAALRGTALEQYTVDEGVSGTLIIEDVDPGRLLELWRAARAVVPVTGRWPVFTPPGGLYAEPTDDEVAALAAAARTIDPWPVYERHRGESPLTESQRNSYLYTLAADGLPADEAAAAAGPRTEGELDRWWFERVVADPARTAEMQEKYGPLAGTGRWHDVSEAQLVLLPTDKQWLAPAWISYFGAARADGYEAWAAAMIEWETRWGAELVAAWGTMLQYVVARRPEPDEHAWQLAGQLLALGGNLEMDRWQLALAVTVGDAWFLHDRP
jgi:Domain of unknown function (DUF4253)